MLWSVLCKNRIILPLFQKKLPTKILLLQIDKMYECLHQIFVTKNSSSLKIKAQADYSEN